MDSSSPDAGTSFRFCRTRRSRGPATSARAAFAAAALAVLVAACGQNDKNPVGIAPVPTSPKFGLTDPSNGDGVCMGDDAFAFGKTDGMASATNVNCTAEDIEIAVAVVTAYSFDNVTFTPDRK